MNSHSLHRISHHGYQALIGAQATAFVLTVLSLFSDPASQFTAATEVFASLIITITAVISMGLVIFHRTRLCEPCLARMPLNGAELAQQWQRSLRWTHRLHDPVQAPFLVLTALLVMFSVDVVAGPKTADLLMYVAVIAHLRAVVRHDNVQPWCKRCHWCRGDDDETAVAPTPSPAAAR